MSDIYQYLAELSPEQKRKLLTQLLEKKEANVPQIYPLSYGQHALWFLNQLAPESGAYNEASIWRIHKEIHIPRLYRTLQTLVDRHPVLRTVYPLQNGRPVQKVLASSSVDFTTIDGTGWSQVQVKEFLASEKYKPIDLENGPVFRVQLLTLHPQEHLLLVIVHHIAIDLWSFMILLDELSRIYTGFETEQLIQLPELRTSYRDYVRWQIDMLAGPQGNDLWAYWQKQLSNLPMALQLPVDYARPATQTFAGAAYAFTLTPRISQQLETSARGYGVTLYTLLCAAFQVLLYRYTGQEDICICSPTNGRGQAQFDGIVGYFVNPVVIRSRMTGCPSFRTFLHQVYETIMEAMLHQDYPFPLLVGRLQLARDGSRSPLSDVAFVMEQVNRSAFVLDPTTDEARSIYAEGATGAHLNLGEFDFEWINTEQRTTKFDLELSMTLAGGTLSGMLQYNSNLFERTTIVEIATHFQVLLQSILAEPDRSIDELPLLSSDEYFHILNALDSTSSRQKQSWCVHELIEHQVERTPNLPAVVFENQRLSYDELNRRANQLAHYLRASGIGPEVRAGLCIDRSLEFIVGLLAVLKAGGAYVPLDPTLPRDRLQFMIEDASLKVLLTRQDLPTSLSLQNIQVVDLSADWPLIAQHPESNPTKGAQANNLAYLIYTSGSTGKPKGVLIEHCGLVNYTREMQDVMGCQAGWQFAIVSTPAADLGNTSIFCALATGGCLHIIATEKATDGEAFARYQEQHPIDVLKIVPSHLRALLTEKQHILPRRVLILGGEALPWTLIEQLQEMNADCVVLNHYGPTETTIGVLVNNLGNVQASNWSCLEKATASVPLGQPLAGTQVCILDDYLQPVPIGVPGELYIAGAGLARGYCNRSDLTSDYFIPHPFSAEAGARLYKTGDLVRQLRQGKIEFLGRKDRQIKLRGFRIEPGEIESQLVRHPAIRESIVLTNHTSTDTRLVAYLVTDEPANPSVSELRSWLQQSLPDYMIPASFIFLASIPLNANGKLDLQALPMPDHQRPSLETSYVAPLTAFERTIVQIWQNVLHLEQVGIQDNFFELGGNSLLMSEVHQHLKASLQHEISLVTLFRYPTIGSLANFIGIGKEARQFNAPQDGYDRASSRLTYRRRRRPSGEHE